MVSVSCGEDICRNRAIIPMRTAAYAENARYSTGYIFCLLIVVTTAHYTQNACDAGYSYKNILYEKFVCPTKHILFIHK